MGNKASKSVTTEPQKVDPSLCLYIQGINTDNKCGKGGCPLAHEKVLLAAVSGMSHSIGILTSGEFVSWGSNKFGQLGTMPDSFISSYIYDPATISSVIFPKEIGNSRVVSISAGMWHSACVLDNGRVYAWGLGTSGQLGINPKSFIFEKDYETGERFLSRPTLVESLISQKIITVNCGSDYTIVLTAENKVLSFGNGSEGVLGNGNTECTHIPQEIIALSGKQIKKIACGWRHCLALSGTGKVYTWGNQLKEVVDCPNVVMYPEQIEELDNLAVRDIACGDYHSCALVGKQATRLYTWGSNGYGQLGNSDAVEQNLSLNPIPVLLDNIVQVACGGLFTVARTRDGSVYAWGSNRQKQIGEGLPRIVTEPYLVLNPNNSLKRIACGYSHVMFFGRSPFTADSMNARSSASKYLTFNEEHGLEDSKDFTSDRV